MSTPQALFDSSMDKGLSFLHKYREHQAVEAPAMSIVGTLCHILSAYVTFLASHGGFGAPGKAIFTYVVDIYR